MWWIGFLLLLSSGCAVKNKPSDVVRPPFEEDRNILLKKQLEEEYERFLREAKRICCPSEKR